MKTNLLILILFLLSSCEQSKTSKVRITVFSDKTDIHIPRPTINQVMQFFDKVEGSNVIKEFSYQEITNTSVNQSYSVSFVPHSFWDNELQKKKSAADFKNKIEKILKESNKVDVAYQNSTILKPLFRTLNQFNSSINQKHIVLLYSDLLEANDLLNVYQGKNSKLLLDNPKTIATVIESQIDVPKLNNVELYIIYTPRNMKDNLQFEKMVEVYQLLFKDKRVHIQVGMTNTIPL